MTRMCRQQRIAPPGRHAVLLVPVIDSGQRAAHQSGRLRYSADFVDDASDLHGAEYTIFVDSVKKEYPKFGVSQHLTYSYEEIMDDRDRIREALKTQKRTQADLAAVLRTSVASVGRLLRKERRLTADERDQAFAWLGLDAPSPSASAKRIPVIGMVSAGAWKEAVEHPIGWILAEGGGPHTFALQIEGDSMDLLVPEGGHVAVDPDDLDLISGRIYVVQGESGDATIKRYRNDPARLEPMSSNPQHQPILLGREPVRVIGRVVWAATRL